MRFGIHYFVISNQFQKINYFIITMLTSTILSSSDIRSNLIAPVGCNIHTELPPHTTLYPDLPTSHSHMVQVKPRNTYDTIAYTGKQAQIPRPTESNIGGSSLCWTLTGGHICSDS